MRSHILFLFLFLVGSIAKAAPFEGFLVCLQWPADAQLDMRQGMLHSDESFSFPHHLIVGGPVLSVEPPVQLRPAFRSYVLTHELEQCVKAGKFMTSSTCLRVTEVILSRACFRPSRCTRMLRS